MADIFSNILKLLAKLKPDWLHETMPYICSVAGIVAIFHFDSPAGYGASALFLISALLIRKMRRENWSLNVIVE